MEVAGPDFRMILQLPSLAEPRRFDRPDRLGRGASSRLDGWTSIPGSLGRVEGWSFEIFTMDAHNDMKASPSLAETTAEDSSTPCSNGQCPTKGLPSRPCPDPHCPFQLEGRLWSRARRNLMLLYNGGRPAPEHIQGWSSTVGVKGMIAPNSSN